MAIDQDMSALVGFVSHPSYSDVATVVVIALILLAVSTDGLMSLRPDPYYYKFFEVPQAKDAERRLVQKQTRNVALKLEECGKQMAIFWGSQSGTGEAFATSFARECRLRFGIETITMDLSDYDAETISLVPSSKIVVFILSTYGEGDPSDNAHGFWDWITKTQAISAPNLRYMAFGLGNSNYKSYNRIVDVVTATLDQSGATRLVPVGKANDANGTTEEDFFAWKSMVFSFLRIDLGFEEKTVCYEPTVAVEEDDSLSLIDLHHGEPLEHRAIGPSSTAISPIKALSVKTSTELFTGSTRSCLHLEFDLSEQHEVHYKTGDHLAVWPMNPDSEVERLLNVLGISNRRDVPLTIKSLDPSIKLHLPTTTSAIALFRYYMEICAPISREAIRFLADYAPTAEAQAMLVAIAEHKDTYAEYASRNVVNLGRVLEAASPTPGAWSKLPLSWILETVPHIKPRYYSISSSSIVSPHGPSITAVVLSKQIQESSTDRIYGVTTNYLSALKYSMSEKSAQSVPPALTYTLDGPNKMLASGKVHAHIRKSTFKLPALASHPIIMVAAGTGIAPFRGFVSERARLKTMGKPIGRTMLFFGCRQPNEDFLYKDELLQFQSTINDGERSDTPTMSIVTAFSREDRQRKVYVQHRVTEHAAEICHLLLEQNSNFYICGSAGMAREVAETVGTMVRSEKGWSEAQWKEWNAKQRKTRKWQEDVWG